METPICQKALSVSDIERSRVWYQRLGLAPTGIASLVVPDFEGSLHQVCATGTEHELTGPRGSRSLWIRGGSFLIRLLKPRDCDTMARNPRRRLNDIGFLNLAAFVDAAKPFAAIFERLRAMGYPFLGETPTVVNDDAAAIYAYDDQENSIELGFMVPGIEMTYGWRRQGDSRCDSPRAGSIFR